MCHMKLAGIPFLRCLHTERLSCWQGNRQSETCRIQKHLQRQIITVHLSQYSNCTIYCTQHCCYGSRVYTVGQFWLVFKKKLQSCFGFWWMAKSAVKREAGYRQLRQPKGWSPDEPTQQREPGIEWVQACTRQHFAFAFCCQNATSGSPQSRPLQ